MAKFINIIRLRKALLNLADWRGRVDRQGAQHFLSFLAIKESNVNTEQFTLHTEQSDKAFWEKYMYVRPGDEPFFDPIATEYRIKSHFHSNIATARKGTFQGTWRAAEQQGSREDEKWKLTPSYLDIISTKIFSKAGTKSPLPVFDVISWLFRNEEFPQEAAKVTLLEQFRKRFHITDPEFTSLFITTNLDGSTPTDSEFFANYPTDSDLLLRMLDNPSDFDLAEAITEIATIKGHTPVKDTDILQLILSGQRQLILQGPPGTGKTRAAKRVFGLSNSLLKVDQGEQSLAEFYLDPALKEAPGWLKEKGGWMLIQFHPSYAYDDFVQGISVTIDAATKTPQFEIKDGPFLRACEFALQTKQLVFLIIDEINRGDLSKIFGELIYALEYRGQPITLRASKAGSKPMVIPPNLVVIGTMNSADRSIAHIDYAIRRRFSFVTLPPDRVAIQTTHKGTKLLTPALQLFDATFELLKGNPTYAVGHSFFLSLSSFGLANQFVFQVMPLLDEYRREGIIEETASVNLGKTWPGQSGIPVHHDRPFDLVEQLRTWIDSQ